MLHVSAIVETEAGFLHAQSSMGTLMSPLFGLNRMCVFAITTS